MARIKNSSTNNIFGDGKEQILTTDDGKSYTIKNSSVNNIYGTGKEKIIVENSNGSGDGLAGWLIEVIPWWGWVIFFGVLFVIQRIIAA